VNVSTNLKVDGRVRRERIQVDHVTVLVQKSARIAETGSVGDAHDLLLRIDAQSFADGVARQCAEVLHRARPLPQESVKVRIAAAFITGQVGEAHDYALVVDCHRRVPRRATQIAQVHWHSVLPQQRVGSALVADSVLANPRDAYHLSAVVDACRGAIGIAAIRSELLDLIFARAPD